MKRGLGVLLLLLAGIGLGWWLSRSRPPSVPHPPAQADTVYVPSIPVFERVQSLYFQRGADVVLTDTVENIVYRHVEAPPEELGWRLDPALYIDRLEWPVSPGDTATVSLVLLQADSLAGVTRTRSLERLWVGGYLTYMEATPAGLRVDVEPFPRARGGTSSWRWIERGFLFVSGFVLGRL